MAGFISSPPADASARGLARPARRSTRPRPRSRVDLAVVEDSALAVTVPDLGHRGHVDGVVQLTVPAPREAVDPAVPGGHLDGAVPLKAAKRSRLAKRMTSPVMPTIVAATTGPTPKTSVVVVFQATREPRALRPTPPRRTTRDQGDRKGPARATGERLCRLRAGSHPHTPALRPSHSRTDTQATTTRRSARRSSRRRPRRQQKAS